MLNLKGIPKKYHDSILDFYKDEDGWWMYLACKGKYYLDGYYANYTIHEDTKAEAIAVLKACIKEKDEGCAE